MKRHLAAVFTVCLSAAGPALGAGGDREQVSRLLRKTVDEVLSVMQDRALKGQARKDKVMAAVTPVFDFELMGKLALGRKNWPKLNGGQRKEFQDLFVRQLQGSYLDKVDLVSDQKVTYQEPVEKDGKISVATRVESADDPLKLLYRFYKKGADWKIYDVEIQDVSLVKSYGLQYEQALEKGTVEDLLKKMREKVEALEKAPAPVKK